MKKIVFYLVFVCYTVVSSAQSDVRFGLKGGFNLAMLSSAINSESKFKAGSHFGVYLKAPINEKMSFRPEVYYSRQGVKSEFSATDKTTTYLNYITVPLLFEAGNKVAMQFGPQVGFLMSATEEGTIDGLKVDHDIKELFRKADFSLALGVGLNPSEHFNFGLRYTIGLSDIFKADEDNNATGFPDIKNRVFHFYLAYSF
jgi:hypothetical protein